MSYYKGETVPGRRPDQDPGRGDGPLQLGQARPLLPGQERQEGRAQVRQLCVCDHEAANKFTGTQHISRP